MVVAKLLLLLAMLPSQHCSMTPPNARPPSSELRKQVGWELVIPWVAIALRAFLWSWTLLECIALFAATEYCPQGLSQSIVHHLVRSDDPQRTFTHISSLTPTFLAGSILSITGSLLRIHCYGTLGSMFTFELSIRKEHKLITSGVYAIVRHPSYTGGIGTGIGLLLCILSPSLLSVALSSLFPDPDFKTRMMNVLGCTCVSACVVLIAGLVHRMNNEDAMLEKNFGEEWKEWARRVPYRLVPWVY
ncbi:hypothetical protein PAXINDRAFT_89075 [Paxillus involutus ATCC 200175]|uniref:Protein-S-isoprenylcysteine O-methyltransferase n=1 Tax=Paxillus involutus ATCC 200175 TaxID=664439 RepID=A0A0C9TLR5_PAXIN|nr:hypothetical protein PAXINDRAFT_89075 [Paxillus involutus ATCC 200175]